MHLDVHPVGSSPTSPIGGGDSPLNNMFVPRLLACAEVGTIGTVAELVDATVKAVRLGCRFESCQSQCQKAGSTPVKKGRSGT